MKSSALTAFRVMAYVVGVFLLLLVAAMVLKYGAGEPRLVQIVGPIHGFLYAVYLVIAFNLSIKNKWSPKGTILVLLAGTIPFLSFVAERKVTDRVQAGVAL